MIMFFSVTFEYVIWPGSAVPGPPRIPTRNIPGVLGASAGLTDATSNVGEPCTKAALQLKTTRLALKIVRYMKYFPFTVARKHRLLAWSTAIKSAFMIRSRAGICDEFVPWFSSE